MAQVTIYHNPRCSKSRATLELLRERGEEVEVIHYLDNPPDARTLSGLLDLLGLGQEPRQLMRTGEEVYRNLRIAEKQLTRDELIQVMVENPILIERPIVVKGNRAALGRPPEKVLEIL